MTVRDDDFTHIHESLTFPLAVLYIIVSILCAVQIGRIIWNRHNIVGWHTGFLALCGIWAIPRAIFFLFLDFFNDLTVAWVPAGLYWFPVNIQFATFSLLILFYARLVYKNDNTWRGRKKYFSVIYATVNITFFCATVVSLAVTGAVGDAEDLNSSESWENKLWNAISAVMFTILGCVLAYYGWRVSCLMKEGKIQIPFQIKRSSNIQAVLVTALIFASFATRALYELIESFAGVGITITTGFSWRTVLICLFFVIWEILPTCLVILLFWNIPSAPAKVSLLPSGNYTRVHINGTQDTLSDLPQLKTAVLFDNPQRYDSDDDLISVSPYNTTSPYSNGTPHLVNYGSHDTSRG